MATPPAQDQQDVRPGWCAIPPGEHYVMKMTRGFSCGIVTVHAIALVALGFINPFQWIASLCAIIAGGVHRCAYTKCVYTCTPISFLVAAIFDVFAALYWVLVYEGNIIGVAIFPLLALGVTIPGIASGCQACSTWDARAGTVNRSRLDNGAPQPVTDTREKSQQDSQA